MECLVVDVEEPRRGEPIHLSVYGDLHEDAEAVDTKKLLEHMKKRAKLPNPIFLGIGDLADWIVPSDLKRYQPSTRKLGMNGYDEILDRDLQRQADLFKNLPWVALGAGNHCLRFLKRHYSNPAERLAQMLGTKYAGMSGFLRIRIKRRNAKPNMTTACVTVLYHHGAWGGRLLKGFGGARDWARCYDGWDVMVYGHNHQAVVHKEARVWMTRFGNLAGADRWYVNCGTWLKSYDQGKSPSYSEVRGLPPSSIGSPLVRIWPPSHNARAGDVVPKIDVSWEG